MNQDLFPDELAEHTKKQAGKKYRPSNGTEGDLFMSSFCHNCANDINEYCSIIDYSMAFDIEDDEYPKELIISTDGQPRCTFVPNDNITQH